MDSLPVVILAFWILIGGFIGGFLQMMFASCDDNELSFKTAFWYAIVFYENNEDRLNSAGLTMIIVAMSLLLLPGYVLIFFITCLYRAFCKLWEAYKYIFSTAEARAIEKIENAPTVELTDEAAIEHLKASGRKENHDDETVGPHWISVKDRLPEKPGRYLCWFGKNTVVVGASIVPYIPDLHWFASLESLKRYENVTHWMPLPEMPKEEEA